MNNIAKMGGGCLLAFALASNAAAGESLQEMVNADHPRLLVVKECNKETRDIYDELVMFQAVSHINSSRRNITQKDEVLLRLSTHGIVPESLAETDALQFVTKGTTGKDMTREDINNSFCSKVKSKSILVLEKLEESGFLQRLTP